MLATLEQTKGCQRRVLNPEQNGLTKWNSFFVPRLKLVPIMLCGVSHYFFITTEEVSTFLKDSLNKSINVLNLMLSFVGAFLISYCLCFFFCGMPLLFLGLAIGQYTSESGVTAWKKICPMFQGEVLDLHVSCRVTSCKRMLALDKEIVQIPSPKYVDTS